MTNRHVDVDTEIEVELPDQEDSTTLRVVAMVTHSRWSDLPAEDWCGDMHVLAEDGRAVPQDCVDVHGRRVWRVAEQAALDASYQ